MKQGFKGFKKVTPEREILRREPGLGFDIDRSFCPLGFYIPTIDIGNRRSTCPNCW